MLEVIGGQVMRERIVLIGAGSAVFTRGLVADLIRSGAEAELALVDIDPEALEVAERLARKMITARQSPIKLASAVDRRADPARGNSRYLHNRGWETARLGTGRFYPA